MRINRLGELLLQTDVFDLKDALSNKAEEQWLADYNNGLARVVSAVNQASDLRDRRAKEAQTATGLDFINLKVYPQRANLARVTLEVPKDAKAPVPIQALPLLVLYDLTLNHMLVKYAKQAKVETDKAFAYHHNPEFKANTAILLLDAELQSLAPLGNAPLRGVYLGANPEGKEFEIQGTNITSIPRGDVGWVAVGHRGSRADNNIIAARAVPMSKEDDDLVRGMYAAKRQLLERLDLTRTPNGVDGRPFEFPQWWERLIHTYSDSELDAQSKLLGRVREAFDREVHPTDNRSIRMLSSTVFLTFESGRGYSRYPETDMMAFALDSARAATKAYQRSLPGLPFDASQPPTVNRTLEQLAADNFRPARALSLMLENHGRVVEYLHDPKENPTLFAEFTREVTPLKARLTRLQPSAQLVGFTEIWCSALDLLPDLGKGVKDVYKGCNKLMLAQPGLLDDIAPQWQTIQVAQASPWRMNTRTQKMAQGMMGLLKIVCPTFYASLTKVETALGVPKLEAPTSPAAKPKERAVAEMSL